MNYPGDWHQYSRRAYFFGPRRFRLFPRLFWFGLGAGAFAMWSRHKDREAFQLEGADGHPAQRRGWCSNNSVRREWTKTEAPGSFNPRYGPVADASTSASAQAQAQVPQMSHRGRQEQPLEWHTERMREVGKQAGDAMADISENALDSLLTSIQALKAKLAEARAQRDSEEEKMYLEQRIPVDEQKDRKEDQRRV